MARSVESLALVTTESLKCRSWNHAWDHERTELEKGYLYLYLHCNRCESGRIDVIHRRTGEITNRRYDYTPKYLIDKPARWGKRVLFNKSVRIELVERVIKEGV